MSKNTADVAISQANEVFNSQNFLNPFNKLTQMSEDILNDLSKVTETVDKDLLSDLNQENINNLTDFIGQNNGGENFLSKLPFKDLVKNKIIDNETISQYGPMFMKYAGQIAAQYSTLNTSNMMANVNISDWLPDIFSKNLSVGRAITEGTGAVGIGELSSVISGAGTALQFGYILLEMQEWLKKLEKLKKDKEYFDNNKSTMTEDEVSKYKMAMGVQAAGLAMSGAGIGLKSTIVAMMLVGITNPWAGAAMAAAGSLVLTGMLVAKIGHKIAKNIQLNHQNRMKELENGLEKGLDLVEKIPLDLSVDGIPKDLAEAKASVIKAKELKLKAQVLSGKPKLALTPIQKEMAATKNSLRKDQRELTKRIKKKFPGKSNGPELKI